MCDKKNNVLFTETGCLVLSLDFKLIDENQVLLKVPRQNNMYSFDQKNVVPSRDHLGKFEGKADDGFLVGYFVNSKAFFSNYARASLDRKSTTGGCQFLSKRLISWQCKKQTIVANSTTEAEYVAAACCCGQLPDENQVLLKFPRQNNMYSFDLKNVVPSGGLTCLFVKATIDESNLWHRRLGHINFKTTNKLVRGNLVRGLPSKIFENNHTCAACQKEKQHKASFSTACYVQNRVLVTKHHNKTPYELLTGRSPNIEFMKPFGCLVIILNTLDHLGKFEGKADDGFLVGYFVNNGKKVIINEASIRRDLRLDDAERTACLPNATIFEELARMGAKTTAWHEFSSTMASAIICLANNQKFNFSKYILENMVKNLEAEKKHELRRKQWKETEVSQDELPTEEHIPTPSHDSLPSGEDRLKLNELMEICTKLSDMVLSLEQTKTNQAAEMKKLKKRIGLRARIISSDEEGLGDQEDASKQGRIAEIDADEDLFLINETAQDQGRINDQDLFGVHNLDGDEVFVDATTGENVEQDATVVEKVVTTIKDIEVTTAAATTPQISKDELTLAQTLIEMKATEPKEKRVTIQELKPEKPLKKKDQIALDDEVAWKLEAEMKAEMNEEKRIAKEKNEANIAMIEE
nr:ribonuclease H-like domain-containing protein [Tanacetum cinerariifolium]